MKLGNWLDEIQTAPPQGRRWCNECDGTGSCWRCLGTGYVEVFHPLGVLDFKRSCAECHTCGRCQFCEGQGHIPA